MVRKVDLGEHTHINHIIVLTYSHIITEIFQCVRNDTDCEFGTKYLWRYTDVTFFVNRSNLTAVYGLPVKCTPYSRQINMAHVDLINLLLLNHAKSNKIFRVP